MNRQSFVYLLSCFKRRDSSASANKRCALGSFVCPYEDPDETVGRADSLHVVAVPPVDRAGGACAGREGLAVYEYALSRVL